MHQFPPIILSACILIVIAAMGCESRTGNTSAEIEGCYFEVIQQDTHTASLEQHGNDITGKLNIIKEGKEVMTGTVTGKIQGHILRLAYRATSEGSSSIMELCFKYKDGKLLRGTGDMKLKGDSVYFADPAAIKFDGSGLQKTPCQNLPGK